MPDEERPAAQVLRSGQSVTNRIMGLRSSAEHTLWLSTNAAPLRAKPESPLRGVVVTLRDITEQVLLQEALERSLLQFRSLVASLPVGVAVSHGRTMRFVNQALADILGYDSPAELEGVETLAVVHPDSLDAVEARYARMARGELPEPGVLQCRRRDGSTVLVEVTSMPATYEDKPAILALLRDVTESARARREKEQSEARFRALVNFAPVGIFETDREGRCIYVNERAATIMGIAAAEALDLGWLDAVHPDDRRDIQTLRAEAIAAESGLLQERRFVTPRGIVHAQVQTVPLASGGQTTGYLGAMVDLTELRAAHAALLESLGQKETLLKEIHHRVKNNLQVIASLLRIGRSYVKDTASLSVFNDSIARVHSIALIHERLYRSHDLGRIDMADYLRGLLNELVRANATQQRIASQVLVDRLFFDVDRCVPIGLIVGELVSNALKHAFAATTSPALVIALSAAPEGYELIVRDNGSGIDASRTREDSLGLRIVGSLVRQLGGRHHVNVDGGTAWHIVFPGAREPDA